jgi:hypothetical protein
MGTLRPRLVKRRAVSRRNPRPCRARGRRGRMVRHRLTSPSSRRGAPTPVAGRSKWVPGGDQPIRNSRRGPSRLRFQSRRLRRCRRQFFPRPCRSGRPRLRFRAEMCLRGRPLERPAGRWLRRRHPCPDAWRLAGPQATLESRGGGQAEDRAAPVRVGRGVCPSRLGALTDLVNANRGPSDVRGPLPGPRVPGLHRRLV